MFVIQCVLLLFCLISARQSVAADRPNVVLVITDDQGYGDIGAHGNSMIKTPAMDQLHRDSIRLTNFHVDSTCAPSRAALMTGRFSTRTGIWHTIAGRSLLDPRELTLAEVFLANGYRTGMFGKWHLGDNAPLRPHDRGFQRALWHRGGGVTQAPDFWGNDYFDDIYFREDGRPEPQSGYCTDVWFREASGFIKQAQADHVPFFCYLATNAPHGPYTVDEKYSRPYLEAGVPEPMAMFYGMITNIDENLARLRLLLQESGLEQKTLFIFMTDNGTAAGIQQTGAKEKTSRWKGFNAGMRGKKVSPYDGGHRVPCFLYWPEGRLTGGRDLAELTAHIDLLPTLVELCGLKKPDGPTVDGISLAPLLRNRVSELPDRKIFVHTQRIEHPLIWRQSVVLTRQWRLVNGTELYDILPDPGQQSDVAGNHGDVVAELRAGYEQWWSSLEPVYKEFVRIDLGNPAENPVALCCHDWHAGDQPIPVFHAQVARDPLQNGQWAVNVTRDGEYEFILRMRPAEVAYPIPAGTARLQIGDTELSAPIAEGAHSIKLKTHLPAGPAMLQTWLQTTDGKSRGAYYVDVRLIP